MITKADLKQEIEQLDDSYLDLVFRLLQQFPHQKNKPDLLACSRPIHYPDYEVISFPHAALNNRPQCLELE